MAFHETECAPAVIGATPETVQLYITHLAVLNDQWIN